MGLRPVRLLADHKGRGASCATAEGPMTGQSRCPECGAPLDPRDVESKRCANCLLGLALGASGKDDVPVDDSAAAAAGSLEAGSAVGPYRIGRQLGEGGMGIVYLAEQTAPVRRTVALKVIKRGMDTRQVVARFEAERQALALMDHPSIARVFDAGETDDGRPYFAMEHIEGRPITAYCDEQQLGTRERLALFIRVCHGVQHAHHKGVIHRDVKPSNVLVTTHDGKPVPKIIDFGVAKAIEQPLTERTLFTEMGVMIGTPEYMSPEQAEVNPLDVDTRTDVYSLGVLLYELLSGALPFDARELRSAAFHEILRKIREDRPSKPSARVSELGDDASGSAMRRRSDPATLRRLLTGDLDVITMKALEKERERRYGSPAELAGDIERHLNHEPVAARPPSAAYLLRKLVSRHKLATAFVLTVLVLLAGSTVWLSILYRSSQANLSRAVAAEADAEREAETATHVSDFLIGVFEVSDPSESRGNAVTARELLDGAAERIATELGDEPKMQATLMGTMGNVYESLGLYDQSKRLLEGALELRKAHGSERSPEAAIAMVDLATVLTQQGHFDQSEPLALQALEIQEEMLEPDALAIATTVEVLGSGYWRRGEHAKALPLWTRCLEIREKQLPPDAPEVAQALNNLGNLYMAMGKLEDAEPLFLRSLEIRQRVLGPDHPALAAPTNNLGDLYKRLGRYDEAEQQLLRSLAILEKGYGPDHPYVAYALNNLGLVYRRVERADEAVPLLERALRIRENALPSGHRLIPATLDNLGLACHDAARWEESAAAYERALDLWEAVVGRDHPRYANVLNNYGLLLTDMGRMSESERRLLEAAEIWERVLEPGHPQLAFALHNLAGLYAKTGREAEAEPLYRRALEIREAALRPDDPLTIATRERLEELLGGSIQEEAP
jgi:serine/threonine protein kinase/Tfp pilus assembly protein PilF